MRKQHRVVTGIPASGKSTVGGAISEALGFEMLDKMKSSRTYSMKNTEEVVKLDGVKAQIKSTWHTR